MPDATSRSFKVTAAQPFDVSNILEAQDEKQQFFVKILASAKTIELIAEAKYIFNINKSTPVLDATTGDGQMRLLMVNSATNAKVPALRGAIKGMLSRRCTTDSVTGSAATIASGVFGFTVASGHVGGDAY